MKGPKCDTCWSLSRCFRATLRADGTRRYAIRRCRWCEGDADPPRDPHSPESRRISARRAVERRRAEGEQFGVAPRGTFAAH